jgi:beta-lactam-binding protein with PASTA domain
VLGLGKVGAESLLRNADLVPRFEFVHGTEEATVGTVIKQSPARGATAAVSSTVVVMINIGLQQDASAGRYAREASRSPATSSSLRSSEKFFAYAGYGSSQGAQADQSDTSDRTSEPDRAYDDDAKTKSDKGNKGKNGR